MLNDIQKGSRDFDAALRLMLFDKDGMAQFDTSMEGFWRSFQALLVAVPFILYMRAQEPALVDAMAMLAGDEPAIGAVDWWPYLSVELVLYAAAWLVMPLIMIPLSRSFGIGHRYVPFVVAYNWASLLMLAIYLPLYTLFGIGAIDVEMVLAFGIVLFFFFVVYRWYLLRVSLEIDGGQAVALVALETVLSLLILSLGPVLHGVEA